MKKLFSLFLFTVIAYTYSGLCTFAAYLSANTPVTVQAENSYYSTTVSPGDNVQFSVVNNVIGSNGAVLIKQGEIVNATVIKANKRGRAGVSGNIEIGKFYTTSTNGKTIPLNGTVGSKAKSKMGLSIALSVIIVPLFLLMHGKDTQIPQGAQYTLYTAENMNI